MKLEGQVALVTGASRGIGRAVAETMAAEGAAVAVNYRSGKELAEEVVAGITSAGGKAVAVAGDVSEYDQAVSMVEQTVSELGGLHMLVNNARIAKEDLIYNMDPGMWLDVMRVNFGGTFNCTKAALSVFMRERAGSIVNMSSVMGERGWTGESNYSASKGAVNAFTRCCAVELARFGIRVNTVAPGIFWTPMVDGMPEEVQTSLSASIPFPSRLGRPEEFADLVAYLIGNRYLNGETIRLDGAVRLAPK